MINPIEADKLADLIADQLRVRLSYQSVRLSHEDQIKVMNFVSEVLSNYVSTELMTGDSLNVVQ